MQNSQVKIFYSDFWEGFDPENNYFTRLLRKYFTIEINEKPDILIYSDDGKSFQNYNCIKLYYTAENLRPNFFECDFSFTFDYNNDIRNFSTLMVALYQSLS